MAARRNYRGGNRRFTRSDYENKKPKEPEWDQPCPICGKPIYDISSAIAEKNSGNPAHFECIIEEITKSEEIQDGEKVYYLGNGSFGIVQQKNMNQMKFFIRKRIQYENKELVKEWRRGLTKTNATFERKEKKKKKGRSEKNDPGNS